MKRKDDWEIRLQRILRTWQDRPFKWGTADCVHFAGACIYALTGKQLTADLDAYASEREAIDVLARTGDNMRDAADIVLGFDATANPPSKGDIVLADRPVAGDPKRTGHGLGVCLGSLSAFVGEKGLEHIPTNDCLCSWKI